MKYKNVLLIKDTIAAEKSTPGTQGFGEGIEYGVNPYNSSVSKTFYYRFAGKEIPKNGIVYLTHEGSPFSRQTGDKSQIIVAFDPVEDGFRLIEHIPAEAGRLKDKMKFYQNFDSTDDVFAFIDAEVEKELKIGAELKAAMDRGEDLF